MPNSDSAMQAIRLFLKKIYKLIPWYLKSVYWKLSIFANRKKSEARDNNYYACSDSACFVKVCTSAAGLPVASFTHSGVARGCGECGPHRVTPDRGVTPWSIEVILVYVILNCVKNIQKLPRTLLNLYPSSSPSSQRFLLIGLKEEAEKDSYSLNYAYAVSLAVRGVRGVRTAPVGRPIKGVTLGPQSQKRSRVSWWGDTREVPHRVPPTLATPLLM